MCVYISFSLISISLFCTLYNVFPRFSLSSPCSLFPRCFPSPFHSLVLCIGNAEKNDDGDMDKKTEVEWQRTLLESMRVCTHSGVYLIERCVHCI